MPWCLSSEFTDTWWDTVASLHVVLNVLITGTEAPSLFIEDNTANTVRKSNDGLFILYFQKPHKGRNCFSNHVDLEKHTKPQSHVIYLYPYFVLNSFCEVLLLTPHCFWWMVLHLAILIHKFFWVMSMNAPQRKNSEHGYKLKPKSQA